MISLLPPQAKQTRSVGRSLLSPSLTTEAYALGAQRANQKRYRWNADTEARHLGHAVLFDRIA